jgi:hypothetical protein
MLTPSALGMVPRAIVAGAVEAASASIPASKEAGAMGVGGVAVAEWVVAMRVEGKGRYLLGAGHRRWSMERDGVIEAFLRWVCYSPL